MASDGGNQASSGRNMLDDIEIRLTADMWKGKRGYMEDYFSICYSTGDIQDPSQRYRYIGVFDGHGGKEAAIYAKKHLRQNIVKQKGFWSQDDDKVAEAIKKGFVLTQTEMHKERPKWKTLGLSGNLSTAGTTATVVFIRGGKLYVAHVGDSRVVLGYEQTKGVWEARALTKDHKPEDPEELNRIRADGGDVVLKDSSNVHRVCWLRAKSNHKGSVRRSTVIEKVPFLAVARALGDFWSFSPETQKFTVSSVPDVCVMKLDPRFHRCIIVASDGLWNVIKSQQAVSIVQETEMQNNCYRQSNTAYIGQSESPGYINNSSKLMDNLIAYVEHKKISADNVTIVTMVLQDNIKNGPLDLSVATPLDLSVATNASTSQLSNGGGSPSDLHSLQDIPVVEVSETISLKHWGDDHRRQEKFEDEMRETLLKMNKDYLEDMKKAQEKEKKRLKKKKIADKKLAIALNSAQQNTESQVKTDKPSTSSTSCSSSRFAVYTPESQSSTPPRRSTRKSKISALSPDINPPSPIPAPKKAKAKQPRELAKSRSERKETNIVSPIAVSPKRKRSISPDINPPTPELKKFEFIKMKDGTTRKRRKITIKERNQTRSQQIKIKPLIPTRKSARLSGSQPSPPPAKLTKLEPKVTIAARVTPKSSPRRAVIKRQTEARSPDITEFCTQQTKAKRPQTKKKSKAVQVQVAKKEESPAKVSINTEASQSLNKTTLKAPDMKPWPRNPSPEYYYSTSPSEFGEDIDSESDYGEADIDLGLHNYSMIF